MISYQLKDYNFSYPAEAVAREPASERDHARLWILNRQENSFQSVFFYDLPQFLRRGDVLVANDVRVLPVRMEAKRAGGGHSEILITGDEHGGSLNREQGLVSQKGKRYEALISRGRKIRVGSVLKIGDEFQATILEPRADGRWLVEVFLNQSHAGQEINLFETCGEMPLPPYLRDRENANRVRARDIERYQTVFARQGGAVAAPTAGLHFTPRVFAALEEKGVHVHYVTLEVSFGTFRPIRCADFREHRMDFESYGISQATTLAVQTAKRDGRRVIAVGTTVTRTLEAAMRTTNGTGLIQAGRSKTDLFIHTNFQFRVVDALLTNFHLPQSSLLLLACAFGGKERVLAAYQEAIAKGCRLFSYGDAMLIL